MAHPGTLHAYARPLTAFEHASPHPSPSPAPNLILWLGGLGDGPLGVTYPSTLAASLPRTWSLAEVLLSSSYDGWGTGSLARDAHELGKCVAYFRAQRPGAKIVLMGHSTGCQDIMAYLLGGEPGSEAIDGAVLQAGVSDREGWAEIVKGDEELERVLGETVAEAGRMVDAGEGEVVMAKRGNRVLDMFGAACSAYRVWSLLARGGDDDFFSTDLEDEKLRATFGKIPKRTRVMFLWGSEDPYVPREVDKAGTLARWARFVREGGAVVDEVNGGVVVGASHNLNDDGEEVVGDLVGRVVRFVEGSS